MAIQNIRTWTPISDAGGADTYTGPMTTAGNLLVLFASVRSQTATVSFSDNAGNVWQAVPTAAASGSVRSFGFYVENALPINSITFSSSEVVTAQLQLSEWSGAKTANALSAYTNQQNVSTLQPPPAQVATPGSGYLVMGTLSLPVTNRTLVLQGTSFNQTGELKAGQLTTLYAHDIPTIAATSGPEWDITAGSASGSYALTLAFEPVPTINQPPEADAGSDRSAVTNTTVTLSGSGIDPDGVIVGYQWTQTSGPAVLLSDANVAAPTFSAPSSPAALSFQLVVTDNDGATSPPDSVTITVVSEPLVPDRLVMINSSWTEVERRTSLSGTWQNF